MFYEHVFTCIQFQISIYRVKLEENTEQLY